VAYLLSQAVDYALNEPGQYVGVVHPTAPPRMPDNRMEWHTWSFPTLKSLQDWYDDWAGTPALYHFIAMFDKNDPTWTRGQALQSREPGKAVAYEENRKWWESASGRGGGGGGVRISRRSNFGGTGADGFAIIPTPVVVAPDVQPPAPATPDPGVDPSFVNQSATDPSTGTAVVAGHRVLARGARFGAGRFDRYGRELLLEHVTPAPERLVAIAPLLSPGANGLTARVSFDGQHVHVRICIDGRCYSASADLAHALEFLNAETDGDFDLAVDDAIATAGDTLVGALVEDHVHSLCGSWWSDLKHTIFHVQHSVAKTIQKFKVPITIASTAVATYYGGSSAGAAAGKLTGPIIDASAGDSVAKKQVAQAALAQATKEAQTNPNTAKALAAAQTAVAQTTAAYHTVQTVANAKAGNVDAQKQLAELQGAADGGDVQAQKLLGVASDATDAANANAGDSTTINTGPDPDVEMDSDAGASDGADATSSGWGLLPYVALGAGAGLALHRYRSRSLPAPIIASGDYVIVAGFWHDIGGAVHGVGHAAFKVHHFVATTIQKFKAPIVVVAGIVASYYGGPLAGMAATAITGPAIDEMANIGEKKKSTLAKEAKARQAAAAKQLAALQKSDPQAAAQAIATAKTAITKTAQAYHTVEVIKAAANGDPAAKAQLAQLTTAATKGDATAKDLLAIAQKLGADGSGSAATPPAAQPGDPSYVDPSDIEMDGNPDGGNPVTTADAPEATDAMADAVSSGTTDGAYREIAARTAATLHAQGAQVVGVAVGAPGAPLAQTTKTFANSDDADDWFGAIASEPSAYGYVAYYDAADPSWPQPLNESTGHVTESAHVSGLLPLVLTGLGAGVAAAYFWPTIGPKVKALFQRQGAA